MIWLKIEQHLRRLAGQRPSLIIESAEKCLILMNTSKCVCLFIFSSFLFGSSQGIVQSNPNPNGGVGTTAQPPKVFHNTRCTRHHKPHHSHGNGSAASAVGGAAGMANGPPMEATQQRERERERDRERERERERDRERDREREREHQLHMHQHNHGLRRKSESVLSTDSDIRFTRRKLGDGQKCGCAVIAGFLIALLVAGIFVYVGCEYFSKPKILYLIQIHYPPIVYPMQIPIFDRSRCQIAFFAAALWC